MSRGRTDGPITIMIVDDHPLLRFGIAALLMTQPDMQLVSEAEDGTQAIANFKTFSPDVTLMDLQMPGVDGLGAVLAIRKESPQARILVLTTYSGDARAVRALRAGAAGYLLKSSLRADLLDAIRAVHAGQQYVPAEVAVNIAAHLANDELSPREIAILQLVANGEPNKQIAWQLRITEHTVKSHMKSIFVKLDVNDRTEAAIVAIRRGFIAVNS